MSYPLLDEMLRVSNLSPCKRGDYIGVPRELWKQYWRETLTQEIAMRQAELAKLDLDDPDAADPRYSPSGFTFNGLPIEFEDVDRVTMLRRKP